MRTELTYAVDAMNRYNGDLSAAVDNVTDYHNAGGLSVAYAAKVMIYMSWVQLANNGQLEFVPAKYRGRVLKAMRKQMPRVHTEVSNWRLTYHDYMLGAYEARLIGHYPHAKTELRCARHIRQIYL